MSNFKNAAAGCTGDQKNERRVSNSQSENSKDDPLQQIISKSVSPKVNLRSIEIKKETVEMYAAPKKNEGLNKSQERFNIPNMMQE